MCWRRSVDKFLVFMVPEIHVCHDTNKEQPKILSLKCHQNNLSIFVTRTIATNLLNGQFFYLYCCAVQSVLLHWQTMPCHGLLGAAA